LGGPECIVPPQPRYCGGGRCPPAPRLRRACLLPSLPPLLLISRPLKSTLPGAEPQPKSNLVHTTSGGSSFDDRPIPKLHQPKKSQPKQRRLFSCSRLCPWTYFLNGPNAAASIAPTLVRPALRTGRSPVPKDCSVDAGKTATPAAFCRDLFVGRQQRVT